MKPARASVYLIGTKYMILNHKVYALEELDDDALAEAFNGGDALPIAISHEEDTETTYHRGSPRKS